MSCKDDVGNECSYKVRLHFRSIAVPAVPEFTALENAQRVYGRYGICFEMASGQSLMVSNADQLKLNVVDTDCKWDQASDEQRLLFGMGGRQGVKATDILVYYVDTIKQSDGSGLNGCAGHEPATPAVVVASTGSKWTLAHEVGHVLLTSKFAPVHATSDQNLMFAPTTDIKANPPVLSAAQLAKIRLSKYCVAC